jgi:hypothetical protein
MVFVKLPIQKKEQSMPTRTNPMFNPGIFTTLKVISSSFLAGVASIYVWIPILLATVLIIYQLFSWNRTMKTIIDFLDKLLRQQWLISSANVLFFIPMTAAILCEASLVSADVLSQAGVQLDD